MYKLRMSEKGIQAALQMESDFDISAGLIEVNNDEVDIDYKLESSFRVFIKKLRLSRGLALDSKLASLVGLPLEVLTRAEIDVHYIIPPLALVRLAVFYNVSIGALKRLSGAVADHSNIQDELIRFAAQSTSLEKLTKEEMKLLGNFVKIISEKYRD